MKKIIMFFTFMLTIVCVDAQFHRHRGIWFNGLCLPGCSGVAWNTGYNSYGAGGATIVFNIERKRDCYWQEQETEQIIPAGYLMDGFGNYVLFNGQYIVTQSYKKITKTRVKICY